MDIKTIATREREIELNSSRPESGRVFRHHGEPVEKGKESMREVSQCEQALCVCCLPLVQIRFPPSPRDWE